MIRPKGRSRQTVPPDYFRELYRNEDDPWGFATSEYEHAKYEATLRALPRERYRHGLELGCSIGVFSRMLAQRCDDLLAVDVSADAVAGAAMRCADLRHVHFQACDITCEFPRGRFDLVTFCEIGFYFGPDDLSRLRSTIAQRLARGGDLVLVHWTPLVQGHAQTADEVHDAFCEDAHFMRVAHAREATYRLDIVTRL